jgi:hypothetical protein
MYKQNLYGQYKVQLCRAIYSAGERGQYDVQYMKIRFAQRTCYLGQK